MHVVKGASYIIDTICTHSNIMLNRIPKLSSFSTNPFDDMHENNIVLGYISDYSTLSHCGKEGIIDPHTTVKYLNCL